LGINAVKQITPRPCGASISHVDVCDFI